MIGKAWTFWLHSPVAENMGASRARHASLRWPARVKALNATVLGAALVLSRTLARASMLLNALFLRQWS